MLSYITRYEPVRRRLRVKNKARLTIALLILVTILLIIFIPTRVASQVNYKPFKVAYGDTYWEIARELQASGYRPRTDVRVIVGELVQQSGIRAHELREGDTIYVPDLGGLQ